MNGNDAWEGEGGLVTYLCEYCNHWVPLSHDCPNSPTEEAADLKPEQ